MKNEGTTDRILRLAIGVILLIVAIMWISGIWQIVIFILAAAMLVTGFTGFCGLYRLVGINTAKK